MPLKLNVGVSRKLGLPNYASVGISCALEFELEPLVFHDIDTLQARVQEAFNTCRDAVDHELLEHQSGGPASPSIAASDEPPAAAASSMCLLPTVSSNEPLASERQIAFAYHLARQIRGMGGQRLPVVVEQLYARPLAELTASDASQLIDLLRELRAGTRSVEELLADSAA